MDKSVSNKKCVVLNNATKLVPIDDQVFRADKLFASSVKEEIWLNSMAKEGYELCGRSFKGYMFVKNLKAAQRHFSVSYSTVSSSQGELCDITEKIVTGREELGGEFICAYSCKVYFKAEIKEGALPTSVKEDAAEKRRRLKYFFSFSTVMLLFFLTMLCYNLKYWVKFNAADVGVKFSEGKLNDYIVKDKSLWDYTLDMRKWFGEFPCTPHISFFLCLVVLTIPFVAYYLNQYLGAKKYENALESRCKER